jgi:hypothetical protein
MALNFANNNSLSAISALPASITGGAMTLISTQTASSSSTISFTSGIDSTYDEYVFKFYNIHPASDNVTFQVGFRDGSTAYDATKTTTFFRAYHYEDDSGAALEYVTGQDLAQSTNFQSLTEGTGGDNDQSCSGTLHLFNPSSTTFVKHFIATVNNAHAVNLSENVYVAGYCNVTAAIDAVQFKFSSGNIDSGVIKLYGIS